MLDRSNLELPRRPQRLPTQRWQIYPAQTERVTQLAQAIELLGNAPTATTSETGHQLLSGNQNHETTGVKKPSFALASAQDWFIVSQLLVNRGLITLEQVQAFLDPESQILPSPIEEFPDLAISLELLSNAIANFQKIAICGDYDADGMTSTALLLRSLRWLGADVDYAIPSRMKDGYGINVRIVEEFHAIGVKLILTVDNGISAIEAIARAKQLGLKVIVTDHHDIPQQLPEADAILNPKLIRELSPYRGLAGVGVAYILSVSLAQQLGQASCLVSPLLELFTLGTIADLAPLTGVNRRWVKRGLRYLPQSQLAGVRALIEVALVRRQGAQTGVSGSTSTDSLLLGRTSGEKPNSALSLKPEDIGFRLGPRINAIGRIADPQIVIELLTTDDMAIARERALVCEQVNQTRQQLCEQIEQEAIAWVEQSQLNLGGVSGGQSILSPEPPQQERVLVIVQPNWHHGVIGIVASRLVERYGVPVFIGTYEDELTHIRGSARGIPEFDVFKALEFCQDLLRKFGGHKAAGGFSLPAENLEQVRSRLSTFAHQCLQPEHLLPLLKIDAQANLNQINRHLYTQLDALHPCGIENPEPVFWTPNVQVVEQRIVGESHLKLTLSQETESGPFKIKAIAWRWGDYFPLPPRVDIAYRLQENTWNGNTTIELVLVGVRPPTQSYLFFSSTAPLKAAFDYKQRHYTCGIFQTDALPELRIKNSEGKVLALKPGQTTGLLGSKREEAHIVDLSTPNFHHLIQAALGALGIAEHAS